MLLSRRRSRLVALAALAVVSCGRFRDDRPDVVLITIDTLRADRLHLYGSPRPTSPWLDAFSAEAVVFDRAISTAPWTWPSMVSIATGLMPAEHGVVAVDRAQPEGLTTLAEVFREDGYRTIFVGSNTVFVPPEAGYGQGFETWVPLPGVPRDEVLARLAEVLDAAAGEGHRPLFLHVHLFEPHCPCLPEPELLAAVRAVPMNRGSGCEAGDPLCADAGRAPLRDGVLREYRGCFSNGDEPEPAEGEGDPLPDDRAVGWPARGLDWGRLLDQYDADALGTDRALGAIAAMLRERGRWEGSWVAITADHGEEFGEHGRYGHGESVGMETVHVPLLIRPPAGRWPQGAAPRAGGRVAEPVTLTDLAPTLAARAGARGPAAWSGRDLLAPAHRAARAVAGSGVADASGDLGPVSAEIQAVRMIFAAGHRVYVDRNAGRHRPGGFDGPLHGDDEPIHVFAADDPRDRGDLIRSPDPAVRSRVRDLAARLASMGPDALRQWPLHPADPRVPTVEELDQLRALGYTDATLLGGTPPPPAGATP